MTDAEISLIRRPLLFLAVIATAAFFVLSIVPSGAQPAFGTIKVHDDPDVEPPQRNVPHVECEFWVRGSNMSGASGTLVVYSWPPTGDRSVVLEDNWIGTSEEGRHGHEFLNGPYLLDDGHYRVEVFSDDGHPGAKGHFQKTKTFWVHCETVDPLDPVGPGELPCPPSLIAIPNQDVSITVAWESVEGSNATILYRAVGDGPFEYIDAFDPATTMYHDTDTELHVTYAYTATALFGDLESQGCAEVEATAIPVFPTLVATAMAAFVAVAGYTLLRRRA